jgi:hypothetical protein
MACSQLCTDACPVGWECVQIDAPPPDTVFICKAVDPRIYGVCFHGVCRRPCAIDNDCPDVCALKFTNDDRLFCVNGGDVPCGDGFPAEFSDKCSSIWTREGGVCEFAVSDEGPNPVADNCEGGPSACISEGCAKVCKTDADCPEGRCQGFYSFASLPDDTAIGLFKACRK